MSMQPEHEQKDTQNPSYSNANIGLGQLTASVNGQHTVSVNDQQNPSTISQVPNAHRDYSASNSVFKGIGEETLGEECNSARDYVPSAKVQIVEQFVNPAFETYAQSHQKNWVYKTSWQIFTVITSLLLACYLGLEAFSLNALAQGKSLSDEDLLIIKYFMKKFSKSQNLLFINVYLNLFAYLMGIIIILYSVILLLIENDKPWKWFRGRYRTVARWGYTCFIISYVIGGLIQTGFVLANAQDKTINRAPDFFIYIIVKGLIFYANMRCFKKIDKFKFVQSEVFKYALELSSLKMNQDQNKLEQNWFQIYENFPTEETERAQDLQYEREEEIFPQFQINTDSHDHPDHSDHSHIAENGN